jgi:nucleotide-binding universal stress UspA family protein
MRILHPTDFSNPAERARAFALDIKRRLSGSLHIVHVQERFDEDGRSYVGAQLFHSSPELQRRLEEDRTQETKMLRDRLAHLAGDEASAELVWGRPLEELLRLSKEYDLIAMGAHGHNPFDEVFLGGIAGRLVRRSATPVLTVRETCSVASIRRYVVATDFSESSIAALAFAQKLAAGDRTKLVLAHVTEGRTPVDTNGVNERLETLAAGRIDRLVVRHGHPVEVLPQIAADVGADVIVVGLKRQGRIPGLILGSRADGLLRSSPIPILSVPTR